MRLLKHSRWLAILFSIVMLFVTVSAVFAQDGTTAEVAVMPANLDRLSWGAVIAGSILALMIQLGLNLLGVGVGIASITPDESSYSSSSDQGEGASGAARTAAVWIGFSMLISLLAGGWIAARFAGIPSNVDGMLHGLMVWGVVMIVTLLLITTTIGRILSGVSNLIGQGIHLATRATEVVARGAAGAVGAAAQGVSNVASSAVDTARDVAYRAQPTIDQAKDQVEQRVQDELARHPDVRQAIDTQNLSRQKIEEEARHLLWQVGVPPQRVEGEANAAMQDVKQAAQQAAQQVTQDPRQAADTMMAALGRVLDRGSNMVNEVDRQSVIDVMKARTGMTQEEAEQRLHEWEDRVQQARMETERVTNQVRMDVQQRVNQVRQTVESKVQEVRHDVEDTARDAARATTKAISRIALAAFAAILIGAVAAGLGGILGAPEELPTAQIDTDTNNDGDEATSIIIP